MGNTVDAKPQIPLTKGQFATVDIEDYENISGHKWYYSSTGYAMTTIYVDGKSKNVRMHHMIIGKPNKGFVCDHINRNRLDNRRENLRIVSLSGNAQNSERKSYKYRYRGTRPNGRYGWMAYLTHNKKQYYLGTYGSEDEAAVAYNTGAKEHFGNFAVLNELESV